MRWPGTFCLCHEPAELSERDSSDIGKAGTGMGRHVTDRNLSAARTTLAHFAFFPFQT